ncbi:MAG: hypothetical protein ABL971_13010 [Vicinamibacterales bacterium]
MTVDKSPVLATVEGGGQAVRRYGKTAEIAANPRVERCYANERHDQVRLTGVAEVVTDRVRQTVLAGAKVNRTRAMRRSHAQHSADQWQQTATGPMREGDPERLAVNAPW